MKDQKHEIEPLTPPSKDGGGVILLDGVTGAQAIELESQGSQDSFPRGKPPATLEAKAAASPSMYTLAYWSRLMECMFSWFDWKYMVNHLMINVLTVDIINATFERTICVDELLACCDPFNRIGGYIGWFPVNGWLIGHYLAYAWAGCFYGNADPVKHFNVALGQVGWFWFEFWTYYHTYQYEQLTYYTKINGTNELGDGVLLVTTSDRKHPCPELPYYSTWIPIWEDFIYNTAGQLTGLAIWIYLTSLKAKPSANKRLEEALVEAGVGPCLGSEDTNSHGCSQLIQDCNGAKDDVEVWSLKLEASTVSDGYDTLPSVPTKMVVRRGRPAAFVTASEESSTSGSGLNGRGGITINNPTQRANPKDSVDIV